MAENITLPQLRGRVVKHANMKQLFYQFESLVKFITLKIMGKENKHPFRSTNQNDLKPKDLELHKSFEECVANSIDKKLEKINGPSFIKKCI